MSVFFHFNHAVSDIMCCSNKDHFWSWKSCLFFRIEIILSIRSMSTIFSLSLGMLGSVFLYLHIWIKCLTKIVRWLTASNCGKLLFSCTPKTFSDTSSGGKLNTLVIKVFTNRHSSTTYRHSTKICNSVSVSWLLKWHSGVSDSLSRYYFCLV